MHCHCGTNNRAPRWTFTDPCKPEVRPGAREESASPAWLAAPAKNSRDTTKDIIYGGLKAKRVLWGIICKNKTNCKDKVGVLGMVTDLENKLWDYSTRHYKQYPTFRNLIYELLPWQPMEAEKSQNLRLVFCDFLDSFKSRYWRFNKR